MSTENGDCSVRPKEVVTDLKNIKEIHTMVLNHRKFKLNKIAYAPKISTKRKYRFVREYLGIRMLCAK